jgi:hypothetical protein
MKNYFVWLALFLFVTSCNTATENKNEIQKADTIPAESISAKPAIDTILPVKLTASSLPASLAFKGKFFEGWQWTDKLGGNLLITSHVAPFADKIKNEFGETGYSAELHAFHFIKKDTSYKVLWTLSDTEKSCPFDITCGFIKDAATITDLDKDGIAETTIQYSIACRSDVSPAYMKLIMHEDTSTYSLGGAMWVKQGPKDLFTVTENNANLEKLPKKKDDYEQAVQAFGRYQTEKEFANAPPEFLPYARSRWLKFVKEKMGSE